MKKYNALLDFGSTNLFFALHNDQNILVQNIKINSGVRCGMVVDVEQATQSVLTIIGETEKEYNTVIQEIDLIIGGPYITSEILKTTHLVNNEMISLYDMNRLIKASKPTHDEEQVIVHSFPVKWELDQNMCVENPIGLFTKTLTLHTHIIRAQQTYLKNIIHVLHRSHVCVRYCIARALATSLSVLSIKEKKNGAIVLDIGGHTTTISCFSNNHLIYTITVPIGGFSLTFDLMRGLGISQQDAENIKQCNSQNYQHIIIPRVEEILELIKEELITHQLFKLNETIVLTGGASSMPEWIHASQKILSPHTHVISNKISNRLHGGLCFLQSPILKNSQDIIRINNSPWKRFWNWLTVTF